MHAHLLILLGTLLLAPQIQPRAERILSGPLGQAQQASLNQVDILLELSRTLPAALVTQVEDAVAATHRAHETAIRNLIVVERGTVTADYRRWKLRRAIDALMNADRERERVLQGVLDRASPEAAQLVLAARRRARSESSRAVTVLRALDGGSRQGGAGGATSAEPSGRATDKRDKRASTEKRTSRDRAMSAPCRQSSSGR